MEQYTIQKIESNSSLFKQYLKRVSFWDKSIVIEDFFEPSKSHNCEIYGLFNDSYFIGVSLVKIDQSGNVVSFQNVVDDIQNRKERFDYLNDYVSNLELEKPKQKQIGR